ncbi:tyrosine-type recombinase/integrase [Mucilaginibacter ginsenosidivorax]|nr:site-specific integrase [Mucilaginibacter ginsenosidivorax]
MTTAINFTKTVLDLIPRPTNGKRTYHYDSQVRGLAFVIQTSGATSFYLVKKIEGRSAKILLGKYPDLSVENARKKAKILLGQIAMGENPQAERQRRRNEQTFKELFEEYMTRYSKLYKKTWLSDQQDISRLCTKLFHKKISAIDKNDIQRLWETISAENGKHMANTILRRVKAVFNKAIEWGWQGTNPAAGIKKHKEKSRDRFIQPGEMPHLIQAIKDQNDDTLRDYFLILLLTGARRTNTVMMRWDQLNWEMAEWRIPDTKNGDPVIVPLTETALTLLRNRLQASSSIWVFPHKTKPEKHILNLELKWRAIKAQATAYLQEQKEYATSTLMDVRIHDLRRTFGSYQALSGTSLQIIGKSLGHRSTHSTQIYARLNMDAVRASVNKATDMMLALQSA